MNREAIDETGPLVVALILGVVSLAVGVAAPWLLFFGPWLPIFVLVFFGLAMRRGIGHHPVLITCSALVALGNLAWGVFSCYVWIYGLDLE